VGSSAKANLVMSIRSPGKHSVTAIYQGDANTQSSTSNGEDLFVQSFTRGHERRHTSPRNFLGIAECRVDEPR
jgi:hypothetical protein